MKKNENNSIERTNFLNKFSRTKNSPKKFFKKTFGKIGLFFVFAIMILNLNIGINISNNNRDRIFIRINFNQSNAADFWNEIIDNGINTGVSANIQYNQDGTYKDNEVSMGNAFLGAIKLLLSGLNELIGRLVIVAGNLMDLTLKQDFVRGVLINDKVYVGWTIVRDVLNMFFMLLLLFSAFATIFQVEKYHIRKMIIMLVVMALLVNFSYPITLFIIDFSNSAMYFLLDSAVSSTESVSANTSRFAGLGDALANASNVGSSVSAILFNIVLNFIMLVTILAYAMNLLIRVLAFVILLIVSPAGFVFAFFIGTKNVADDWWSSLLKYAFMGPVMIFFFYLAVLIFNDPGTVASSNNLINSMLRFIIPVAFLWTGLIASQKFGGTASGMAMNFATKTGNNIKSYGQKAAWGTIGLAGKGVDTMTGHRISGGIGGLKAKWDSWGENYKSASNTRKTEAAAYLGVDGANEKLVRENMKKMKDEGISDADLNTKERSGTTAERMAVALFRAENNRFNNDPVLAQAQYNNAMNAVRGHQVYENQFLSNARKQNMDLVINENIAHSGATTAAAIQNIIRGELQRLNPDQWKDQNIQRMLHGTTPNRGYIITEGAHVIAGYSTQAQENVTRNMGGQKYAEGSTAGLW